ncbi:MAG: histidine phosphatase family protein [Rhodospirillales bacterium]|nr:histidine phosphatase family protein [Rhodospirillales bacterium]
MLPAIGFWFLRHGETDWNARGLSQGAADVALNANGEAQARRAAELLRGSGIASIVASPLARARLTAEVAAATLGLPVAYDAELREVAFAGREGQPIGGWFDDWVAGLATPPGAESFAALVARAERAVTHALAAPAPVLIVSHGAFFRALRRSMGLPADVRTPNAVPIFCEPPSRPAEPWSLRAPEALSVVGAPGISG